MKKKLQETKINLFDVTTKEKKIIQWTFLVFGVVMLALLALLLRFIFINGLI